MKCFKCNQGEIKVIEKSGKKYAQCNECGSLFTSDDIQKLSVQRYNPREPEEKKGSCLRTSLIIAGIFLGLFILVGVIANLSSDSRPSESQKTAAKAENEKEDDINTDGGEDETANEKEYTFDDLDGLQQLYTKIDSTFSYTEMIETISSSGLPYSEEKYNGSRMVQVSFTEAGTAQNYNDSGEDYLQISYDYPKDENSANDEIEKYTFAECSYVQDAGFTLNFTPNEYYFSDLGNKIVKTEIDNQIDQLNYYLNKY